jgi:S1-C subfamily serine protease
MASYLAGSRICTLEITSTKTAGFTISGSDPPPYTVCKIEPNSPAEQAGLQLNDALLSINGQSVIEVNYEDTIKMIKEALQQKTVQLVVNQQSFFKYDSISAMDSESSIGGSTIVGSTGTEPSHRGTNAVEQYQST